MDVIISRIFYHALFSTRDQRESIPAQLQASLYEMMGQTCRSLGIVLVAAGGIADHVHVLLWINDDTSVDAAVSNLKSASAEWLHEKGERNFAWQDGYAAFTVGPDIDQDREYIEHQERVHPRESYKEEFLRLLEENGIDAGSGVEWD